MSFTRVYTQPTHIDTRTVYMYNVIDTSLPYRPEWGVAHVLSICHHVLHAGRGKARTMYYVLHAGQHERKE
jgi:hypothetical protein